MIRPVQIIRLIRINWVLTQHVLNRSVLNKSSSFLRFLSYFNLFSYRKHGNTRGESIRLALESLGPIFVKFGQLLSIRRDLLPEDIIKELEKLQDQVPPFSSQQACNIIENTYRKKIKDLFASFEEKPLASASVAQVHAATLHDGSDIIVKVIRPNIKKTIRHDIAVLHLVAKLTERFWSQGKRLHPVALVAEFEQTLIDELDLQREAANASQLRRNFENSPMMYVPKIYWRFASKDVMVMERIYGIQISDTEALKERGTNMEKLARYGVEIFFTQVFCDSFFHADMHPGNLFVDVTDPNNPRYLGVDFGIMGTLSPSDQHYLAENLLAFFNRDYRQVAVLHVESGWVPQDTRVDQFESAIRTVCEPIFEKPLSEISFGQLLLRLFQTAERFNMEVQPQLMLLQKTLLGVESLGRRLYPDLDLWDTAKPFMVNWMKKQHGLKRVSKEAIAELKVASEKLFKTPNLLFEVLNKHHQLQRQQQHQSPSNNLSVQKPKNQKRSFLLGIGFTCIIAASISYFTHTPSLLPSITWQWTTTLIGASLCLFAWMLPK